MRTTSKIEPDTDSYIVVLETTPDAVRASLFDSHARRMDGYSAQLPRRKDAAADCLDEMHRLVQAEGLRAVAVVGRAGSEVTPEDRESWPAFAGARWFPALPDGAAMVLGCADVGQVALVISPAGGMLATVVEQEPADLAEGLTSTRIDDRRWMIAGFVPEAGEALTTVKRSLNTRGSIEGYLETAAADDPLLAPIDAVGRRFAELLSRLGTPAPQVVGVMRSAGFAQRIADVMGVPIALCTAPEPEGRGAALWAIANLENKNMNHELLERASRVRMLLMDVDGVLTNAKLYNVPGPDGKMWETKGFDAQDGIALQWMNWYGIETGVISGRVSPAVEERARQVKMTHVYQGHIEKIPILEQICEKSGISADAIAYIGDDLTDVVVMRRVLLGIAPANARPEVKKAAHMVTAASGGNGAVREVCELLLQAQGKWPEILKKYEIE